MRKKSSVHFNTHSSALATRHAVLAPSNPAWVNYDEDKMRRVFFTNQAAAKGARRHALAHGLISERVNLPDEPKTLNMYVNDAIGYRMSPEIMLFFSEYCFGTADCIGYSFREKKLRIFDLKTGASVAKMIQLLVYAALFCLEYNFNPRDIEIELRIYQNNKVEIYLPTPPEIFSLMDNIRTKSAQLEALGMGD